MCWFSLFFHLIITAVWLCNAPWIILSHLRTQTRWRASDRRIQRRREAPLFVGQSSSARNTMFPQPRRRSRLRSSHSEVVSNHRRQVSVQISFVDGWSHSNKMCSRDSVEASQLAHLALYSKPGMWDQKSLILSASFKALYRKDCTGQRMSGLQHPFHRLGLGRVLWLTSAMERWTLSRRCLTLVGVGGRLEF